MTGAICRRSFAAWLRRHCGWRESERPSSPGIFVLALVRVLVLGIVLVLVIDWGLALHRIESSTSTIDENEHERRFAEHEHEWTAGCPGLLDPQRGVA